MRRARAGAASGSSIAVARSRERAGAPRRGARRASRRALGRAEALYRRALEENPADVDCLHMLGVVQMERMRYREALDLLWDAAEPRAGRRPIRHNLGLVLGKLVTRDGNVRQADLLEAFVAREQARALARSDATPLVSVVLPAYNHARFVGAAIASVARRRTANLELVVIDDGSTDGTAAVVPKAIAGLPFPVRFIARENRGAPATLNEGAALASGQYVAFLNSDDYYAPERIARLVDEIARGRHPVGLFAGLQRRSGRTRRRDGAVDILQRQRNFLGTQPNSFTLVEYNVAVSTRQPVRRARLLLGAGRLSRLPLQPRLGLLPARQRARRAGGRGAAAVLLSLPCGQYDRGIARRG